MYYYYQLHLSSGSQNVLSSSVAIVSIRRRYSKVGWFSQIKKQMELAEIWKLMWQISFEEVKQTTCYNWNHNMVLKYHILNGILNTIYYERKIHKKNTIWLSRKKFIRTIPISFFSHIYNIHHTEKHKWQHSFSLNLFYTSFPFCFT